MDAAPSQPETRRSQALGEIDAGFIRRTYRSTLVLAGVGLLYLWEYRQGRLVLPAAVGVAVGMGFLYGAEVLVQAVFTPLRAQARNKKAERPRLPRRIVAQVTIKYLSAILLLWYIARTWDVLSVTAFIGGVCLVQVSIVTRAISRVLISGWAQDTK